MTTLQLNNFCKFADTTNRLSIEDVKKSIAQEMVNGLRPAYAPALITGGLTGTTLGALSTLFNSPENRTWGNALKRALLGGIVGVGTAGLSGLVGQGALIADAWRDLERKKSIKYNTFS